jgi:hypothetical protein
MRIIDHVDEIEEYIYTDMGVDPQEAPYTIPPGTDITPAFRWGSFPPTKAICLEHKPGDCKVELTFASEGDAQGYWKELYIDLEGFEEAKVA